MDLGTGNTNDNYVLGLMMDSSPVAGVAASYSNKILLWENDLETYLCKQIMDENYLPPTPNRRLKTGPESNLRFNRKTLATFTSPKVDVWEKKYSYSKKLFENFQWKSS